MAAMLLALALVQDPVGEEIRALLRRLESSSGTPAETTETLLRLNQAVEQIPPGAARNLLGEAFRGERMPAARRLDLAETMYGLEDRESWTEEAGRIALDASESAETRMRAALLLGRAGAPGAADVGRTLDERLFAEGTEGAARALGTHLREGPSLELQRLEIDFLFRLPLPAARLVLLEAMADDDVDPALRLEIAERLQAAGGLDRFRDARAALERIRALNASLADRVDRLLAALKGIQEDPAVAVTADAPPAAVRKRGHRERERDSSSRVNLIVAAGTAGLLALLLGWKRRG